MKKTPHLKAFLKQYEDLLTSEEFESFDREVTRLLGYYSEVLGAYPPGAERGRKVHELINEQEALSSHIKTSCQRGCGACCHLEVEITKDDATILADSLAEGLSDGLGIDMAKLYQMSLRKRLDVAWEQGFIEANRCVFLGADNACRNYYNRPTVCRKHSVISAVDECEKKGGQPVPKLMPVAEIIMSAAVNLPNNEFGALAKMLQQTLEERALAKVQLSPLNI
ncbi:YkgJ family cysteine cluster protein [Bdellovibrio svalbardensis]|uniref:YkgJ family cysteine cluster protein n=1 Tax=Bdellovibrio svalbardensis TaxID=2972972 RepID=A0ABT6DJ75_9BACT|nr:YkgJ family cysteine cluster protein [Bdellovibrio svalbardensis]MDG0816910.1 YkgJ family cysteine cluster protein [Bdellovibrio svalbardensis]